MRRCDEYSREALNGKVERSQRTDRMEFYATVNLKMKYLPEELKQWQRFYNEERPHGGLGGKTPFCGAIRRWRTWC